jgi:hypothetical protein
MRCPAVLGAWDLRGLQSDQPGRPSLRCNFLKRLGRRLRCSTRIWCLRLGCFRCWRWPARPTAWACRRAPERPVRQGRQRRSQGDRACRRYGHRRRQHRRHGSAAARRDGPALRPGVRALDLESFLRAFTFSHRRQLDGVRRIVSYSTTPGTKMQPAPAATYRAAPGLPRRRPRGRADEVGVRAGVQYERVAGCRRPRGRDAVDGLIDSESPATSPWGQPLCRLTAPGQPGLGMLHACLTTGHTDNETRAFPPTAAPSATSGNPMTHQTYQEASTGYRRQSLALFQPRLRTYSTAERPAPRDHPSTLSASPSHRSRPEIADGAA